MLTLRPGMPGRPGLPGRPGSPRARESAAAFSSARRQGQRARGVCLLPKATPWVALPLGTRSLLGGPAPCPPVPMFLTWDDDRDGPEQGAGLSGWGFGVTEVSLSSPAWPPAPRPLQMLRGGVGCTLGHSRGWKHPLPPARPPPRGPILPPTQNSSSAPSRTAGVQPSLPFSWDVPATWCLGPQAWMPPTARVSQGAPPRPLALLAVVRASRGVSWCFPRSGRQQCGRPCGQRCTHTTGSH